MKDEVKEVMGSRKVLVFYYKLVGKFVIVINLVKEVVKGEIGKLKRGLL